MSKYLNPDEIGHENKNIVEKQGRPLVKNLYCPRDGHYCEQPDCDNCMFETVGGGAG